MTNQTQPGPNSVHLRTGLIQLLAALIAALIFIRPAYAQSDGVSLSPEAQTILDGVNQARTENGLPPLALSSGLTLAAQRHVDDVIANGNWGHYGSDGSNVQMRGARVGYPSSAVSENWVAVANPDQALGWWMNDWIHRVNILEARWDEIGVGAAQAGNGYWILVTDFGNIDGAAMPPLIETASASVSDGGSQDGAIEALPDDGEYAIQPGDTLLGIAVRYGLDWQDIALSNNMVEDEILQVDRVIHLPGRGGTGGPVEATTTEVAAGKQTHAVRPGETLSTIAARYQIAWQDIASVNELGEYDLLQVGQMLKLPASLDDPRLAGDDAIPLQTGGEDNDAPADEDTSADESIENEAPTTTGFVQEAAAQTTYTVRGGDTLLAIALRNHITWQALADANDLDEDSFLQIGQELMVPLADQPELVQVSAPTAPVVSPKLGQIHRVEAGDTIFGIAEQHDVDWHELLSVNDLEEDSVLQLDQVLKLP